MNIQRELERFLRQQLFKERSEPIAAIELRHAAAGAKGNIVDDFDWSGVNTDNISVFVDDIIARAQNDADGIGGVQRYELHVLSGQKKVNARFAFRLRSEDDSLDEIGGEEAANTRGLLTQLMRHNEQQNRTMVNSIGAMVTMMHRTIERQEQTIENLLADRHRNWEIIEKARSQEHERELELLAEHRKSEREDMLFQKINMLFPIIINRLSGKQVLSAEEKSVLGGFVESLTEEQFHKITSTLTPEQQILLLTAIKEIKQKSLTNGQVS